MDLFFNETAEVVVQKPFNCSTNNLNCSIKYLRTAASGKSTKKVCSFPKVSKLKIF